jgi:hypothetical protein
MTKICTNFVSHCAEALVSPRSIAYPESLSAAHCIEGNRMDYQSIKTHYEKWNPSLLKVHAV